MKIVITKRRMTEEGARIFLREVCHAKQLDQTGSLTELLDRINPAVIHDFQYDDKHHELQEVK